MGRCIICNTSVEGRICESHEEDVVFDFRGDDPHDLVPGRFYRGTVDGYADFGVFVDLTPGVTGLLHRSELDQRLESLDWEPGDDVFVQVTGVRDNGNIDLSWSIRQSERGFRGALIQENGTERETEPEPEPEPESEPDPDSESATGIDSESESGSDADADSGTDSEPDSDSESGSGSEVESDSDPEPASRPEPEAGQEAESASDSGAETGSGSGSGSEFETETEPEPEPSGERERVPIGDLGGRVGDAVRLEGEIVGVQQTGGPTVFELRDETGVVDCAAFVEAGVRAYPSVEVGDAVRIDGEVELRREELQVETSALATLDGEAAETVRRRLADALAERARPDAVETPLAGDAVEPLADDLLDAAESIRRAVLESRPVVVRHPATAEGYVAGAAIERAALPLIRDEHAKSDAEYHYLRRRPIEGAVYDMDDATTDATRMLQNRDRHGEKLPLFCFVGTGATTESADGLGLLGVYDAERIAVDGAVADEGVRENLATLVSPAAGRARGGDADADGDAGTAPGPELSTAALAATLAATVNPDVAADLRHLPAVGYRGEAPDEYVALAREAGYDADRVRELREAIELEAYYQSYEDKRELVTDLLFDDGGDLAAHVSEQYREKLETEVETATANLRRDTVADVTVATLDADAYSHRFDFPPTALLADELHRRHREGEFVTLVLGTDELYLRATRDLPVRSIAEAAAEYAPEADIAPAGVREGRIEFLSGERDAVEDAVIAAIGERF